MKTITILEHKNKNIQVSYENWGETVRGENDVKLLDWSRQLTVNISDEVFAIISKTDKWSSVCRDLLDSY